jgi:para-aminobenzoate synthetase component 1
MIGWGCEHILVQNSFTRHKIDLFQSNYSSNYIFGFVGYDAKNSFFKDHLKVKPSIHNFPESVLFTPKHVIIKKNNKILYFGTKSGFSMLRNNSKFYSNKSTQLKESNFPALNISKSKLEYVKDVNSIKINIQQGNIYEMNYCQNYAIKNISLNSIITFSNIQHKTKAPFSTFFKFNNLEVLSASPERYICKQKKTLTSQPIKGTAARGKNKKEDNSLKESLLSSIKEQAENIMIVDLIRNDFSKLAEKKSVIVRDLCKLHTFETVHQLISTVQCTINNSTSFESILSNTFPMGSMTGAPKLNSLKFIEEFENFKRNIYSGTIGFIEPNNNLDFNVVIRSIIYNELSKTLNIPVGGAITIKSKPFDEYIECKVKLNSIAQCIHSNK